MNALETVLTEAVTDITDNGYQDFAQVQVWLAKLREAMNVSLRSVKAQQDQTTRTLQRFYRKVVSQTSIRDRHGNIPRFTIERIEPQFRDILAQKIRISADLIVMNREAAIDKTLQRFAGWASSIPEGGSLVVDKRDVKGEIRKSLRSLSFEERRVAIDQGHKLMSAVDDVISMQGGAIAKIWHDVGQHDKSYDARKDHLARSGKVFAVRGSWAMEAGFLTKGAGYTDEVTQPAEEVYCQCYWQSLYNLRDVPADMLTAKGKKELERVRVAA
jgi:hypothetical protein